MQTELMVVLGLVAGCIGVFWVFINMPNAKKTGQAKLLQDDTIKYSVPLIEKKVVSHDTRKFRFALPSSSTVLGLPVGQHIYLSARINNQLVIRPYTPVTADNVQGYFDLVIKVYFKNSHPKYPDGGKMSQYLESLSIGDKINIRGPSGLLQYNGCGEFAIRKTKQSEDAKLFYKKIGLIAGGTGITPMFQIIHDILMNPEDKTEIWLLFANQTENDILLRNELEKFKIDYPSRFHLWFTVDKPTSGWKYSEGFISAEMIQKCLPKPDEDTLILLCGPPPMINFACSPNLDKLQYPTQHRFAF